MCSDFKCVVALFDQVINNVRWQRNGGHPAMAGGARLCVTPHIYDTRGLLQTQSSRRVGGGDLTHAMSDHTTGT